MIPLLNATQEWYCPNCGKEDTTHLAPTGVYTHFHTCPRMAYVMAPMVRKGTAAKVERREREDYVNGELVTKDENGRPVMSIVTTRDDGQDCVVFMPTATATVKE